MKLRFYKTMWGWQGTWAGAAELAVKAGFSGLEGPLPREPSKAAQVLADYPLDWIAEISTTGYAVPEPGAGPDEHLAVLRREVERALPLRPRHITSMAGNDLWPVNQSVDFFGQVVEIAKEYGVRICCETHRGRSLFHPRVTMEVIRQLPELVLTADFSHWCSVCERLVLDDHPEFLAECLGRVKHLHARVGYDQGAQVPDPRLPLYDGPVQSHLRWWTEVLRCQQAAGENEATLTPEFGPDGYQQIEAGSGQPWGDLWEINCFMATLISKHWDLQ